MNSGSPISPSRRGSDFLGSGSKPTNLDLQPYDPNDGYDYNNAGEPPEGVATNPDVVLTGPEQDEKSLQVAISETNSLRVPGAKPVKVPGRTSLPDIETSSQDLEDHVHGLEGPKSRIGYRKLMQWRAKVPSDLEQGRDAGTEEQTGNLQSQDAYANGPSKIVQPRQKPTKKPTIPGNSNETSGQDMINGPKIVEDGNLKVKTQEIKLHWKKIPTDEESQFELNVTKAVSDGATEDHLMWHHREDQILNIEKLKDVVYHCRSGVLSDDEIGLTQRLLNRVRIDAERPFRGGYFLFPHANRYDGTHVLRDKADVACTFFNFPYFSFAQALPEPKIKEGQQDHPEDSENPRKDNEHPIRTLLQSRYRLNKTTERDKFQAPRQLEKKTLNSFIKPHPKNWDYSSSKLIDEILYVPQIWGLVLGTNTIITTGPLTSSALQGPVLKLSPSDQQLSLIQISFGDEGRPFNYPVLQCLSWFGLLNKQRRILEKLDIEKSKANPRNYRFYVGMKRVTINNWAQILRDSGNVETLKLEMRSVTPGISVQHSDDSNLQPSVDTKNTLSDNPLDSTGQSTVSPLQVSTPFLEWPVLDQFGDPFKYEKAQRIRQFLVHIKRSLISQGLLDSGAEISNQQQTGIRRPSGAAKAQIQPRSLTDIEETVAKLRSNTTTTHLSRREHLFDRFKHLLTMFVPEGFDSESNVISFYWGGVDVVVKDLDSEQTQASNLIELTTAVSNVITHAEELHGGVHRFQAPSIPDRDTNGTDSPSDGAVLLEVMIEALAAVFKMVIESARFIQGTKKPDSTNIIAPNSNVRDLYNEACNKLKDAKDQLIVESDTQSQPGSVGSVVTPETIMILLMKRLAHGVYGDGCIDIVGVYEECFQQLASEVEFNASRRLLKRINGFREEIDIINDIFKQQQSVLSDYLDKLNPATFERASGQRKMRFAYEKKHIDKFIKSLQERSTTCAELKERARELAVQNVQLVETLQDDSNKAILIFTMVAVIFLPLSFVSGYFGMNFADIAGTKRTSNHFWKIAAPLTGSILILCVIIAVKGEQMFFAIAAAIRWTKKVAHGEAKVKAA